MAYKRKYQKGKQITSLDELAKQKFVYFFDKITHNGWFMSWQFRMAQKFIERGCLYYAERTPTELTKLEHSSLCETETYKVGE